MGEWLAEATARQLGKALVGPALRIGCSQHHLAFPGTISIESATLLDLIISYGKTLLNHGFRRAVVVSSAMREAGICPALSGRLDCCSLPTSTFVDGGASSLLDVRRR